MRYVKAKHEQDSETLAYRVYIGEALKCISSNSSKPYGGSEMKKSIVEMLLHDEVESKEDTRSEDDVKAHMKNRLEILGRVNDDII